MHKCFELLCYGKFWLLRYWYSINSESRERRIQSRNTHDLNYLIVFHNHSFIFFPPFSDLITCKPLIAGGIPLFSFSRRMGAVIDLLAMFQGELFLFVHPHVQRARLQPNLHLQDKKPMQHLPSHQRSSAVKQKQAERKDTKILSFALVFLAFHFLLHWQLSWEYLQNMHQMVSCCNKNSFTQAMNIV